MGHVAVVGAEFRVLQTVAAHFGVLVVDWVDEEEDNRDDNDCERHKSGDKGKVILCNKKNQKGNLLMFAVQNKQLLVTVFCHASLPENLLALTYLL